MFQRGKQYPVDPTVTEFAEIRLNLRRSFAAKPSEYLCIFVDRTTRAIFLSFGGPKNTEDVSAHQLLTIHSAGC